MYKDTTELKIIYDATKIVWPEHYAIIPIDILKLSIRATHVIEAHNVSILGDFNTLDFETLKRTKNCGIKTVHEIVETLHEFIKSHGLELAEVNNTPILEIENWYSSLTDNALFYIITERYNIRSESDFLLIRETSDDEDLISLDDHRFKYYVSKKPNVELKELLYIVPKWVLNTNVEFIPFKTRVHTSFREHKINLVKDLCNIDFSEIINWSNFGANSLKNIINSLIEFSSKEQIFPTSYATEDQIENKILQIPLLTHIENSFRELDDSERNILESRLGYNDQKNTLEEVGAKLGVTRERIRQIEKKAFRKLINYNYWDDVLIDKISRMLFNRKVPLYISILEIEDVWFQGCSEKTAFIAELIHKISKNRFSILNFGEHIISKITQEFFDSLVGELLDEIENITIQNITKDELYVMIKDKLASYDCNDLNDIFIVELENKLLFRYCEETNEEYLVGVGNGIKVKLMSLLQESEVPIHYSEITRRFNEKYECNSSTRVIHSKFGHYSEFKLFGRGIYGLMEHLNYDESQKMYVIEQCEKMIEQININKQWSCHELLNSFHDKIFVFTTNLDKYKLDIILQESRNLKSMGRQIWIHTGCDKCLSQSRLDIESTCIQLLKKAGRPLSNDVILQELGTIRGYGEFLILQPNEYYTRVAPNLWGLVERDFNLNTVEKKNLLDKLWSILKDLGYCLHMEELKEFLDIEQNSYYKNLTDYMIYSLANLDLRFKVFRGNFIGLSNWIENKRFNFSSAVREVVSNMALPMTTTEVHKEVEKLTMRQISKNKVSTFLSVNSSVVYDKNSGLWLKIE